MNELSTLEVLLARYELFEPELGLRLRTSDQILALGQARTQLAAWQSASLAHAPQTGAGLQTFRAVVEHFQFPENLRTALLRDEQPNRYFYYWNTDAYERVESLSVTNARLELRYSNRKGRYLLEVGVPPLAEADVADAQQWLRLPSTLSDIARAKPLSPEIITRLNLVPAWTQCRVRLSHKAAQAMEPGVKFMCRALNLNPAYLLILRGLGGEASIRSVIENELRQHEQALEAAVAALPVSPDAFWAAPELPTLPLPHEVTPGVGLGGHLPPASFWAKAEDNVLLTEALAKVYKNIPRKLAKLTQPIARRPW